MLNHQNNKFSISNLLSYKQNKNKLKRIEHKRQTLYLFKLKMIRSYGNKTMKKTHRSNKATSKLESSISDQHIRFIFNLYKKELGNGEA